ncbi:hypothetical protein O181_020864 [Austropuccinia psidii MF-1]|uniref:Uncharacterized protein n=1 Tax=Austropuccinia psidii MF-1 TaxID=1389203 RepID=A0A9Q3GW40_9BASI|nr:hypothetical protein [Austropuccinia psidii MF-1]
MVKFDFITRYQQPVSVNSLDRLDSGTLSSEMIRLEDSIRRLILSNKAMIDEEVDDWCDQETRQIFQDARQENLSTIESQKERVEMIKLVLQQRLDTSQTESFPRQTSLANLPTSLQLHQTAETVEAVQVEQPQVRATYNFEQSNHFASDMDQNLSGHKRQC